MGIREKEIIHRAKEAEKENREEEMPLYRTYGVKKKVRPVLEKINLTLGRILAFGFLGMLSCIALVSVIAFYLFFPEAWIKIVVTVFLGGFVMMKATKNFRKRRKFCGNLKKIVKRNHYRLQTKRSFFASFSWSEGQEDFVLDTKQCRYHVRYLTVKKYRSSLNFEDKDHITLVQYPLENRFTLILDLQPKFKVFPLPEPPKNDSSSRRVEYAILVNPVGREMKYKDKDGSMVATGTGAKLFGYTVYTANGFLEAIQRNDRSNNSSRISY